jgi:hypothetical protein
MKEFFFSALFLQFIEFVSNNPQGKEIIQPANPVPQPINLPQAITPPPKRKTPLPDPLQIQVSPQQKRSEWATRSQVMANLPSVRNCTRTSIGKNFVSE